MAKGWRFREVICEWRLSARGRELPEGTKDDFAHEGEGLAHEMGHYLGVSPADYDEGRTNELMYYAIAGGSKILHSQAHQANPDN